MRKTAEIVSYSLVFLLILIAVFTYLAPHFGWRVDAVTSGSMEPTLHEGSIVIVRPVDPETIQTGDIVSFRTPDFAARLVTHRVMEVSPEPSPVYGTKGDANAREDPFSIMTRDIEGKVVLTIPFVGAFIGFLKTTTGFIVGIVLPGIFVMAAYALSVWREVRNNRRVKADSAVPVDNEAGRY